jgi:hypothetical protein
MSKKRIPTLSEIVFDEVKIPFNDEVAKTAEVKTEAQKKEVRLEERAPQVTQRRTYEPKEITQTDEKKGRASTTVYLPPEVKRQLEEIWFAERHEKSQNDLFLEGLDHVFKHRGLPSIKELVKES